MVAVIAEMAGARDLRRRGGGVRRRKKVMKGLVNSRRGAWLNEVVDTEEGMAYGFEGGM